MQRLAALKDFVSMPGQIAPMSVGDALHAMHIFESEDGPRLGIDSCRPKDMSIVIKTDKTAVKEGIDLRGKQETVPWVQPFYIGRAIGPGLDMTCPKELGNIQTREGATALPIAKELGSKQILAHSLHNPAFGLCGQRKVLGFEPKCLDTGLRELIGQLKGAADEGMEAKLIGGAMQAAGIVR